MGQERDPAVEIATAVRLVGEVTLLAKAFDADVRGTVRALDVLPAKELLRLTEKYAEMQQLEHRALEAANSVVKDFGHRAAAGGLLGKYAVLEEACLRAHRAWGPYMARAVITSAGEHPQAFSALVLETRSPVPVQGPAAE
jgi:hypothetical protein